MLRLSGLDGVMTSLFGRQINEDKTCRLCLNIYSDPRLMRCGHSFCRSCIDKHVTLKNGQEHFSCPVCKEIEILPSIGATSIQRNSILAAQTHNDQLKENCCVKGCHNPGYGRCNQCNKAYCVDCETKFHVQLSGHNLVPYPIERRGPSYVTENPKQQNLPERESSFITPKYGGNEKMDFTEEPVKDILGKFPVDEKRKLHCLEKGHEFKEIELYCYNDGKLICSLCVHSSDHREHRIVPIVEIAGQRRKKLQKQIEGISDYVSTLDGSKSNEARISKLKQQIEDSYTSLRALLEVDRRRLLEKLTTAEDDYKKDGESVERTTESVKIAVRNIKEQMENQSDLEMMVNVGKYERELKRQGLSLYDMRRRRQNIRHEIAMEFQWKNPKDLVHKPNVSPGTSVFSTSLGSLVKHY